MKTRSTISIILIFCFATAQAQFGINAGYVNFTAPEFAETVEKFSLTSASRNYDQGTFQIGIDYWFRLKNKRIEFMPELSLLNAQTYTDTQVSLGDTYSNNLSLNMFQLNFNTQIYPFDFAGDCDCPTFSKDGDILKKGFFIRVAPGASMIQFKNERTNITDPSGEVESLSDQGFAYNLRAGIGLDIGVSDFFTITPLAQYTFTSRAEYIFAYGDPAFTQTQSGSTLRQFFLGVRLGFRFDELNKYGYR